MPSLRCPPTPGPKDVSMEPLSGQENSPENTAGSLMAAVEGRGLGAAEAVAVPSPSLSAGWLPVRISSISIRKAAARSSRDRQSVVSGKSVSVRVDLGGSRFFKKKKKNKQLAK